MSTERKQTIRQDIINLLEKGPLTPRDISQLVSITEKDVYHHLASIEKTIRHQKKKIHMEPYYCMTCGFQFKDRKTFKKPSKCPGCKDGRDVPANVVVVGNPAQVVKELDPERGFNTRMDYFADPAELERFFDAINREVLAGNSLWRWVWSVVYPASRR